MRYFVACVLVGCSAGELEPMSVQEPGRCAGAGGALPTPLCGEGGCGCCGGCLASDPLCFGDWGRSPALINGTGCKAQPAGGTVTAMVGRGASGRFVGQEVAGVADVYTFQVSATSGDETIALSGPAAPGDYPCGTAYALAIGYFSPSSDFRTYAGGRWASCTLTVQRVGAVGERIEGTFTAELLDWKQTAAPLSISGAFDVERVPYP